MRLKSRGLGRQELVLDFREYEVVSDGDEIVVVGTIRDPVHWDFSIRICQDDIPGMMRLVMRRPLVALLLRSLFRRNRIHHWGQERAEHLAEGKRRLQIARETAQERVLASKESATRRRPRPTRVKNQVSPPANPSAARESSAR